MIKDISTILNRFTTQWLCILSNGYIIESSMKEVHLGKMIRILRAVVNDIEVGTAIMVRDMVIYRITFNFFIFIRGNIEQNLLEQNLKEIKAKHGPSIENHFDNKTRIHKLVPSLALFSMTLEEGPTPVSHVNPSKTEEVTLLKVSMKTMLQLSVELEGAKKSMISFQPYVELDSLGIVNLFQIEDPKARGGFYDSGITVLTPYSLRAVIYENYAKIETIMNNARDFLIREYNSTKNYEKILEHLTRDMGVITFKSIEKNEDLKAEMLREIKKLANL